MKAQIPNFITLLNLLCGCIAVIFAVNGNMNLTALFVFLGIFFDFFDGLLARKLKVESELGLQLDSLADMVTSGLAPGLVMYYLIDLSVLELYGLNASYTYLPYFGLLITLASAYRLANFNIDENQTESFIGLPTPANTLLILSLPLILEFQNNDAINAFILNKWFLIGMTLLSCYLLNANIKLLALKFKTFTVNANKARYLLIILSIILLVVFQFIAIPLIIVSYIIISYFNKQ